MSSGLARLEKSWCVCESLSGVYALKRYTVTTSQTPHRGYRIWQRATWHVPPEQWTLAERQIAGPSTPPATATPNSLPATPLSFPAPRSPSAQTAPGDVTREVALKTIPKKKVKGNEESVWSEMQVLQGLDHPNIVRSISPSPFFPSIMMAFVP